MIVAAWICLLSPLGAALLITLLGNGLSRRGAGYLATFAVLVSFVCACIAFFALAVMAIAASEVVVGLGLIVAMARRHLELDVDKLRILRG